MSNVRKIRVYKDMLQLMIERGINHTETVHNTIASFVYDVSHQAHLSEPELIQLQKLKQKGSHRAYDFARDLNRQFGQLATEFLGVIEHRDNINYLINPNS